MCPFYRLSIRGRWNDFTYMRETRVELQSLSNSEVSYLTMYFANKSITVLEFIFTKNILCYKNKMGNQEEPPIV